MSEISAMEMFKQKLKEGAIEDFDEAKRHVDALAKQGELERALDYALGYIDGISPKDGDGFRHSTLKKRKRPMEGKDSPPGAIVQREHNPGRLRGVTGMKRPSTSKAKHRIAALVCVILLS